MSHTDVLFARRSALHYRLCCAIKLNIRDKWNNTQFASSRLTKMIKCACYLLIRGESCWLRWKCILVIIFLFIFIYLLFYLFFGYNFFYLLIKGESCWLRWKCILVIFFYLFLYIFYFIYLFFGYNFFLFVDKRRVLLAALKMYFGYNFFHLFIILFIFIYFFGYNFFYLLIKGETCWLHWKCILVFFCELNIDRLTWCHLFYYFII